MSPLKWFFARGAGVVATVVAKQIPLHRAPQVRRVSFHEVPIGREFRCREDGIRWVRVSADEARPAAESGSVLFAFNNPDQQVDLFL